MLKKGAVGLFDALGFKGIWRTYAPDKVLQRLRGLSQTAKDMTDGLARALNEGECSVETHLDVASFSDTLIVTCTAEPRTPDIPPNELARQCVAALVVAAASVSAAGVSGAPPILYRGAIAFGEFAVGDGQFFVGPAIDEAARMEGLADAAMIYLCPTAAAILRGEGFVFSLPFRVPLKGGHFFTTHVANPLAWCAAPNAERVLPSLLGGEKMASAVPPLEWLQARFLSAFNSTDLDVVVKGQNTAAFLDAARASVEVELRKQKKEALSSTDS